MLVSSTSLHTRVQGSPTIGRLRIGRFIALEVVGRGGTGTVVAAYDPQLDRRVALKILSARPGGSSRRDRLLDEARAMARLSDPHVVPVYEVGTYQEHVFMAMELVEGVSLRAWLAAVRPSWREVLGVFIEAGRGLAAAHAAGLVHRDFKPDNVLVGEVEHRSATRGRVRVTDFGLASTDGTADPVTGQAGLAPGTPAYMAPEQFLGEALDARTDQFAFCVALWEALYGERPFAGPTRIALADAVVHGRLRPPPSTDVPGWIEPVLSRGLAVSPEQRHPSMSALLRALERDPAKTRRRLGLAGLLVATVSAAAGVSGAGPAATCSDAQLGSTQPWTDAQRERLRQAFAHSGALDAAVRAEQTIDVLDRYAKRLGEGYRDACEAASAGSGPPGMLDRRVQCLARRRQGMAALLDVLTEPDAVAVEHAVDAAAALPAPEPCGDTAFVLAGHEPPSDPATAARVESLRAALARSTAELRAGHPKAARRVAEAALREAEGIDYFPVRAEAGVVCGKAREATGALQEAEALLQASYFGAIEAGADDTAAEAAAHLVYLVGHALQRDADGMTWARHARVASSRPGVDPSRKVRLAMEVATVHLTFERLAEAETELAGAIEALRERGDDVVDLAIALNSLGGVMLTQGRMDEARALFHEALERFERTLGEGHPHAAIVHQNLGTLAWHQEAYDRARDHQARSLAIRKASLGPEHPDVAASLVSLAGTAVAVEDYEGAHGLLQRALAILEPDAEGTPAHTNALHNLAVVQRALEHPDAVTMARRALDALERSLGSDHLEVARAHANLGWILLERGDPELAENHFDQALVIRETSSAPLGDVADVRFGIARARWAASGSSRSALSIAEVALAQARRAGPSEAALADRIATWIESRDL